MMESEIFDDALNVKFKDVDDQVSSSISVERLAKTVKNLQA